jgi:four helix bundle protein
MATKSYKELIVWQAGRELAVEVYELCAKLPADEKYGLCSQMKRAAISIPSNIAEGYRRNSRGEYVQFLGIAQGSAAELETQLLLAYDIFSVEVGIQLEKVDQVQRMLQTMIYKLRSK